MSKMITYNEALDLIKSNTSPLESELIYTDEIIGRVCAEDILSPIDVQPFNNSAMDGFALNSEDIKNADQDQPVTLICLGKIAAGEFAELNKTPQGHCWEIMTGAMMPNDCNAIVPVENISRDTTAITFTKPCNAYDNLRFKGEDFKKGELALTKDTICTAEHILLLATLGVNQVPVYRKIKIALISTGTEIVNDLKQPLESGQIYNSTGPYILNMLNKNGIEISNYSILSDTEEEFYKLIKEIKNDSVDLILSTGAVSAGKHDFIKPALLHLNAEIIFHKVFMRPGKPNLFARLNCGTLYFGLPGNPAATMAGLRFLAIPLLRKLWNLPDEKPLKAKLTEDFKAKDGFRVFLKSEITLSDEGQLEATILKGQKSFMVKPFSHANAWAVSKEKTASHKAGEYIDVYPLEKNTILRSAN